MNQSAAQNYRVTEALWLGTLPSRWAEARAKRVFKQSRLPKLENDEQLSATQRYGVVPQSKFMELEGSRVVLALSGTDNFKHVDQGDFVISLRSFQGGIERCYYEGCVSPAYTVLKKRHAISEDFFAYLLKCDWFISALQIGITGIREGKNISYDDFGDVIIPLPPLAEQTAIARFLDRETARIDSLIEKKTRFIELLWEKRTAVITHAVTHFGLTSRIKYRFEVINGYAFKSELFSKVGTPLVRQSNLKSGRIVLDDTCYPVEETPKRFLLQAGDLCIGLSGSIENYAVVRSENLPCALNQRVAAIRAKDGSSLKLMELFFQSSAYASHMKKHLPETTIVNIDSKLILNCPFPDIDKGQQMKISKEIDTAIRPIEHLIAKTERSIDLLREKRSALITAAVTGKIDVRDAA